MKLILFFKMFELVLLINRKQFNFFYFLIIILQSYDMTVINRCRSQKCDSNIWFPLNLQINHKSLLKDVNVWYFKKKERGKKSKLFEKCTFLKNHLLENGVTPVLQLCGLKIYFWHHLYFMLKIVWCLSSDFCLR